VAEALENYNHFMPEDTADANPLIKQATDNLVKLLTKQLLRVSYYTLG